MRKQILTLLILGPLSLLSVASSHSSSSDTVAKATKNKLDVDAKVLFEVPVTDSTIGTTSATGNIHFSWGAFDANIVVDPNPSISQNHYVLAFVGETGANETSPQDISNAKTVVLDSMSYKVSRDPWFLEIMGRSSVNDFGESLYAVNGDLLSQMAFGGLPYTGVREEECDTDDDDPDNIIVECGTNEYFLNSDGFLLRSSGRRTLALGFSDQHKNTLKVFFGNVTDAVFATDNSTSIRGLQADIKWSGIQFSVGATKYAATPASTILWGSPVPTASLGSDLYSGSKLLEYALSFKVPYGPATLKYEFVEDVPNQRAQPYNSSALPRARYLFQGLIVSLKVHPGVVSLRYARATTRTRATQIPNRDANFFGQEIKVPVHFLPNTIFSFAHAKFSGSSYPLAGNVSGDQWLAAVRSSF